MAVVIMLMMVGMASVTTSFGIGVPVIFAYCAVCAASGAGTLFPPLVIWSFLPIPFHDR